MQRTAANRSGVWLGALALIVLAACSTASDEPQGSDEIIPLAKGNYWIYETTTVDKEGNSGNSSLDTMRVIGSREVSSKDGGSATWFEVYGFMVKDTILLKTRPDGLWMIDKLGREVHYYRTDIKRGETYERPPAFNIMLQDTNATVNTAAGKFSGLQYMERFGNAPSATTYYFAPGIGLVEWVATNVMMTNGSEGSVRTTLKESNLQ